MFHVLVWHHTFYSWLTFFSFIRRGVSFQTLGCVFVSELCTALLKRLTLLCVLGMLSRPSTDIPEFYGKCGFNCVMWSPLASLRFCDINMGVPGPWGYETKLSDQTVNQLFYPLFQNCLSGQLVMRWRCLGQRSLCWKYLEPVNLYVLNECIQ